MPPWGPAENAREITLDGSRAKLLAMTSAAEFAIAVTAEKDRKDGTTIAAPAREAVRLAVAAQRLAEDRAFLGLERGEAREEDEAEGRDSRAH